MRVYLINSTTVLYDSLSAVFKQKACKYQSMLVENSRKGGI